MNARARELASVASRPTPSSSQRGRVGVAANAMLEELSNASRIGLKGARAAEWLQQQGCDVPAIPNSWRAIGNDASSVVARLGSSEFFLEQSAPAGFIESIGEALSSPIEGVYPVLREDRAFALHGIDADDVLAQVCNVDLKSVSRSDRHVVMTMMIGIAVLVIPQNMKWGHSLFSEQHDESGSTSTDLEIRNVPISDSASDAARQANGGCYRIWCDPSYGDYLWSSLQDVIRGA
jgi:sarcosine oxidase, subunit gamma